MTEQNPIALESRPAEGNRQFSPSTSRNREVIGEVLSGIIPQKAHVLEIASGTGEHALHICKLRPDLTWQTSDPNPEARNSQNDWAKEAKGHMLTSLDINTAQEDWANGLSLYDALFCANMIHIAPWEAALGLASAAPELIKPDGLIVLYGPFKDGDRTALSNLNFDVSLKSRDPKWGVRDLASVKHIFAKVGFSDVKRIVMPKNNLILVFQRS